MCIYTFYRYFISVFIFHKLIIYSEDREKIKVGGDLQKSLKDLFWRKI